jgi:hypothetical protein
MTATMPSMFNEWGSGPGWDWTDFGDPFDPNDFRQGGGGYTEPGGLGYWGNPPTGGGGGGGGDTGGGGTGGGNTGTGGNSDEDTGEDSEDDGSTADNTEDDGTADNGAADSGAGGYTPFDLEMDLTGKKSEDETDPTGGIGGVGTGNVGAGSGNNPTWDINTLNYLTGDPWGSNTGGQFPGKTFTAPSDSSNTKSDSTKTSSTNPTLPHPNPKKKVNRATPKKNAAKNSAAPPTGGTAPNIEPVLYFPKKNNVIIDANKAYITLNLRPSVLGNIIPPITNIGPLKQGTAKELQEISHTHNLNQLNPFLIPWDLLGILAKKGPQFNDTFTEEDGNLLTNFYNTFQDGRYDSLYNHDPEMTALIDRLLEEYRRYKRLHP